MCIRRFCWIGPQQDGVRLWQVHAEVVDPCLDATQVDVGFTEIYLDMPWRVCKWDKGVLLTKPFFGYKLPHHRVATVILMLDAQALEVTFGSVALLLENVPVVLKDLMNDAKEGTKFGRYRSLFTLVARALARIL
jgi:hypothetical protein